MSKHTPGPWIIKKGDEWTCGIVTHEGFNSDGDPIYWSVASYNLLRDEAKANARLIAAAPDLLGALTAIVNSLSEEDEEGLIEHAEQMIAARAAIAKAMGEV